MTINYRLTKDHKFRDSPQNREKVDTWLKTCVLVPLDDDITGRQLARYLPSKHEQVYFLQYLAYKDKAWVDVLWRECIYRITFAQGDGGNTFALAAIAIKKASYTYDAYARAVR